MLAISQGMTRSSVSGIDRLIFDKYDTNCDGIISYSEFNNFISVNKVNEVGRGEKKENKKFDVEQFDPKGNINLECNGGYNAQKINFLA